MKMNAAWILCLPLLATAQESPAPELAASINDAEEATISPGWPLILDATIMSSDGGAVALGQNWSASLRVEMRNAGGQGLDLPWRLVRARPDAETIEKLQEAEAVWVLPPEGTTGLAPGTYTIAVTLDGGDGANSAGARPLRLTVQAEPGSLSKEMDAEKALLQGQYALLIGAIDQAMEPLNALVERQPDLMPAFALRGDVHFAAGRWSEALDDYRSAIEIFKAQNPGEPHRPRLLYLKRNRAAQNLAKQP